MGRPIGSVNREKPFTDVLRVALLRAVAVVCASSPTNWPRRRSKATYRPSGKSRIDWTGSQRRPSNAAMPRWRR